MSYYYLLSWAPVSSQGQHGHLLSRSFYEGLRIKGTSIQLFQGYAGDYSSLDVLFYFVARMFFPPTSFMKPNKTTLSVGNTIVTLQVLSSGAEEGIMPVFRESWLKPLNCRVPQY